MRKVRALGRDALQERGADLAVREATLGALLVVHGRVDVGLRIQAHMAMKTRSAPRTSSRKSCTSATLRSLGQGEGCPPPFSASLYRLKRGAQTVDRARRREWGGHDSLHARSAGAAVLLALPTVLAFFSGGYFDEARLWAAIAAFALVLVAVVVVGRAAARRAGPGGSPSSAWRPSRAGPRSRSRGRRSPARPSTTRSGCCSTSPRSPPPPRCCAAGRHRRGDRAGARRRHARS